MDDTTHPKRAIAVFGDTHGHLRLMFQLCRLWQREHGRHLDLVLQCGDLGFYPDPSRLDRATLRFAQEDPEELGFPRYFLWPEPLERDPLLDSILEGPPNELDSLRCRVLWVSGNHEDHGALEQIVGGQDVAAVDAFGVLEHVASGATATAAGLAVGAVGGAPEVQHRDGGREELVDGRRYIEARACDRLVGEPLDVLISHGAPQGLGGESDQWGSPLLRRLVERAQPAYHFYAHHAKPIPPGTIGSTRCTWLADVNFERTMRGFGALAPGCMGLLRWRTPEDHSFELVDEPWIRSVTAHTWQYL